MSTRTRSRGAPLAVSSSATTCVVSGSFRIPKAPNGTYAAGSYGSGNHYVVSVPESRGVITDDTGSFGSHHAVTHTQKSIGVPQFTAAPIYKYVNTTSPFGSALCTCASALAIKLTEPTLLNHQTMPDGTLVARARVPALNKKQVDGLVELYELKDLVHMLGSIASLFLEAEFKRRGPKKASWGSIFKDVVSEFSSSPSSFLNTAINAHLGYKFAVSPLAKVVNNVHSTLGRVDKTLRTMAETPFAVHGTFTSSKTTVTPGSWVVANGTFGLYQTRITTSKTTEVTWTETALRQLLPNKLPSLNRLRLQAISDGLGLKPGLSAIWAVIPRSFVLDWFFPISDFLEQLDGSQPSDSWFSTLNTYSSVKTRTTGSITEEFQPLSASGTSVSNVGGLEIGRGDFSSTTYTRSVLNGPSWLPAQIYVPEPRIPSLGQWSTIAEMLFQGAYKSFKVKGPSLVGK